MHAIIYAYAKCLTLGHLCDYNDNFYSCSWFYKMYFLSIVCPSTQMPC